MNDFSFYDSNTQLNSPQRVHPHIYPLRFLLKSCIEIFKLELYEGRKNNTPIQKRHILSLKKQKEKPPIILVSKFINYFIKKNFFFFFFIKIFSSLFIKRLFKMSTVMGSVFGYL